MTEAQWLACTDPHRMLHLVHGRASERRLRLFGAACCRRVAHILVSPQSLHALDVAERFADGLADARQLASAHRAADLVLGVIDRNQGGVAHRSAAAAVVQLSAVPRPSDSPVPYSVSRLIDLTATAAGARARGDAYLRNCQGPVRHLATRHAEEEAAYRTAEQVERRAQAALLRDLFSDLRELMALPEMWRDIIGEGLLPKADPQWLAWEGGTVARLARAIYDDRDFAGLPVLADALEDAGCDSAELLSHLRGPGPHSAGCWALDLLMSRR